MTTIDLEQATACNYTWAWTIVLATEYWYTVTRSELFGGAKLQTNTQPALAYLSKTRAREETCLCLYVGLCMMVILGAVNRMDTGVREQDMCSVMADLLQTDKHFFGAGAVETDSAFLVAGHTGQK